MTSAEYQESIQRLNAQIEQTQQSLSAGPINAVGFEQTWWSTSNAMTISASVLVFGLIICLLAAFLLKQGKSADNVLKTLGTILIIVASLFLVVAGYSDKQIAPVIGLLGTIVGYLLGKGSVEGNT